MSDGPHRSLPLRKGWKKVAEWTDNRNFDIQQVIDCVSPAIIEDFRNEVSTDVLACVKNAFAEAEVDLFPDQRVHDLSNARRLVDGSPLGCLFLECAAQAREEGMVGQQGLLMAAHRAFQAQMDRRARQIEEHHLRNAQSAKEKPTVFCQRLNAAMAKVAVDDIVRQALRITSSHPKAGIKRMKLDDGVPL